MVKNLKEQGASRKLLKEHRQPPTDIRGSSLIACSADDMTSCIQATCHNVICTRNIFHPHKLIQFPASYGMH